MKDIFKPGDVKFFEKVVEENDTAAFDSGEVHPVYATFSLARDAEWVCRLFVLEMKDEDEEGIGTMLSIFHTSPALKGSRVYFEAEVKSIIKNEIICNWKAHCNGRMIARGEQGQKILKKEKIELLFQNLTRQQ